MFDEIEKAVPKGWIWSLYSGQNPRAVLVSEDYKIHIGRDGSALEEALSRVCQAARKGEKH